MDQGTGQSAVLWGICIGEFGRKTTITTAANITYASRIIRRISKEQWGWDRPDVTSISISSHTKE
jgi:hypothetical protein